MPRLNLPDQAEGQDVAETFDEANITPDGRDIAASDLQRDVFDATRADDDADEAQASDAADFDPDALDEAEYEELVLSEEDLDEPRSFGSDHPDRVADDDEQPADYEAGAGQPGLFDAEDAMADRVDRDMGRAPDASDDDRAG